MSVTAACLASLGQRVVDVGVQEGIVGYGIIAMIARAFVGQNPFEVWRNGEQIRNWT